MPLVEKSATQVSRFEDDLTNLNSADVFLIHFNGQLDSLASTRSQIIHGQLFLLVVPIGKEMRALQKQNVREIFELLGKRVR